MVQAVRSFSGRPRCWGWLGCPQQYQVSVGRSVIIRTCANTPKLSGTHKPALDPPESHGGRFAPPDNCAHGVAPPRRPLRCSPLVHRVESENRFHAVGEGAGLQSASGRSLRDSHSSVSERRGHRVTSSPKGNPVQAHRSSARPPDPLATFYCSTAAKCYNGGRKGHSFHGLDTRHLGSDAGWERAAR